MGGEEVSGVSRRDVEAHMMLCILLHNFQRPSVIVNLTHDDFKQAETMENGDRVAQV